MLDLLSTFNPKLASHMCGSDANEKIGSEPDGISDGTFSYHMLLFKSQKFYSQTKITKLVHLVNGEKNKKQNKNKRPGIVIATGQSSHHMQQIKARWQREGDVLRRYEERLGWSMEMWEEGGCSIVLKSMRVWKSRNDRKRKTTDKAGLIHLKASFFFS